MLLGQFTVYDYQIIIPLVYTCTEVASLCLEAQLLGKCYLHCFNRYCVLLCSVSLFQQKNNK